MPAGVWVELGLGLWLLVGTALPHWQVPEAQTLVGAREEPSPEPQGLPAFLHVQCWAPRRAVFTALPPPLLPSAWLGGGWASLHSRSTAVPSSGTEGRAGSAGSAQTVGTGLWLGGSRTWLVTGQGQGPPGAQLRGCWLFASRPCPAVATWCPAGGLEPGKAAGLCAPGGFRSKGLELWDLAHPAHSGFGSQVLGWGSSFCRLLMAPCSRVTCPCRGLLPAFSAPPAAHDARLRVGHGNSP